MAGAHSSTEVTIVDSTTGAGLGAVDEEARVTVTTFVGAVAALAIGDIARVAAGSSSDVETEPFLTLVTDVCGSVAADTVLDDAAEALNEVGSQGEARVALFADVVELADGALGHIAGDAGAGVARFEAF